MIKVKNSALAFIIIGIVIVFVGAILKVMHITEYSSIVFFLGMTLELIGLTMIVWQSYQDKKHKTVEQ